MCIIQSYFKTKIIQLLFLGEKLFDYLIHRVFDKIFISKIKIGVINTFWTFHLSVKWSCKHFLTKLYEKLDQFVTKIN